jgi:hypothetical protein
MGRKGLVVVSTLSLAACIDANAATVELAGSSMGSCPISGPQTVVSDLQAPFKIEVDDGYVYYFNRPPNVGVFRTVKSGGSAELIGSRDFDRTGTTHFDFDFDAAKFYLMDFGDDTEPSPRAGAVSTSEKDGSSSHTVYIRYPDDCRTIYLLEIAGGGDGTIYWLQTGTQRGNPDCTDDEGVQIARLDPGATGGTVIAQVGAQSRNLRADASHVFWSDEIGIWRLAVTGGTPELLFATTSPAKEMVVDANAATFHDGAATFRVSAPGAAKKILDQPLRALRSDGAYLYGILSRGPGVPANVVRVKPNGHGQTFLAKGAPPEEFYPPEDLAVDDTFVYYYDTTTTTTEIRRVCKAP